MDRLKTIKTFSILGDSMKKWGSGAEKEAFNPFVAGDFYSRMHTAILGAKAHNGWFSEQSVKESFCAIGETLSEENLTAWLEKYPTVKTAKSVGLILAGNIPLVGFHDILSTVFSGNKASIKLSSDDKILIPMLLEILVELQPELRSQIELVDKLNSAEAVIATGSDNTARYFEKYFGHLPRVIRKNRTSVAVINGTETPEELKELGKDIFTYYGLGCRNVSHLLLPKGYNLDHIFGAIVGYGEVINHHKYCNNYDYYKAVYLMNQEKIIENGFVLTREIKELFAPVAVLHYHFYESEEEKNSYLEEHKEKIQAIVGKDYLPFGAAQSPALDDYADGVDTMEFLSKL
ncbi:acyl-CoA reductase [Brumimicrobium glaciale]|jgi:glycosyltransferase involved in cell wall biosynthesis|uniref:Acyl-CoA reductase n=1 Tax=Brumimicrobium glaciale TaxID=200475 RepID=A0A4Q4KNQ1_9FLAO|nr:acyl-CoA reductase [Brumimicrobium glaciale]RYM33559.1 acyl-CoA reductase [Brumimicrobium glaciale]